MAKSKFLQTTWAKKPAKKMANVKRKLEMKSVIGKPIPLMTEEMFIAKFKKEGFDLYKSADLKPKLDAFHKMEAIIAKLNGFKL